MDDIDDLRRQVASLQAELTEVRKLAGAAAIAAGEALTLCSEVIYWSHQNLQRQGWAASPMPLVERANAAFDALRADVEGDERVG